MPDYQSGYREDRSCKTVLLKLTNDLLWSMERKNITVMAALDLSAAFDTVDHKVLHRHLQDNFGISGIALEWFRNYLNNRYMKVKIEKTYSERNELASCSRANLFYLYCGTIREVGDPSCNLLAYVDNHAIIKELDPNQATEERNAINLLMENLNYIKECMNSVRLKMNNSKSEFIIFGNKTQVDKCITDRLRIEDDIVNRSQIVKYLGAWLDRELTLKTHVKKKCASAMLNLQGIKNIQKFLDRGSCTKLVVCLCLSHLDYSHSILCGLPKSVTQQMQNIQNYAAKLVLGRSKYSSNKEALAEVYWFPIKSRIKVEILVLVFKCLRGEAPEYLMDLLVRCTEWTYNLRSSNIKDRLVIPRIARQTFAARSFSMVGPTLWNKLPNHIRNSNSLDIFKKSLKTFLFAIGDFLE